MKFLMMIKHAENYRNDEIPKGLLDAMGQFVGESLKSGVLLDPADEGRAGGTRPSLLHLLRRSSYPWITPLTPSSDAL